MEFKPRAPREGINVSAEHPLKEAVILLLGVAAAFALVVAGIAWGVDLAVRLIPTQTEARLFAPLRFDMGSLAPADSEAERQRVQAVIDRLAAHWPESPYDFVIFLWEHDDPNAAALPGGSILVTTALLEAVESENELAFVLGHELGHFKHRDHLRRLGRGVVYGLALAAISDSGASVPDLSTLAGDLTARSFDRDHERAADHFGLELVAAEYGHVDATWRFFERLARQDAKLDGVVAYLSTHPASAERITDIKQYAAQRGWPLEGTLAPY